MYKKSAVLCLSIAISISLCAPALLAQPARLESIDPLGLDVAPMHLPESSSGSGVDRKIVGDLWQRRHDATELSVIVLLSPPASAVSAKRDDPVASNAALVQAFASRATARGMRVTGALSHFPIVFGRLAGERLLDVAALPEVSALQRDHPVYMTRVEGAAIIRADQLRTSQAANGAGVGVAVVDSGVDDAHPELATSIAAQGDYTGTTNDGTVDGTGHGTGVAGIIAGTSGGLAPASKIWALKVFDNAGNSSASFVQAALNSAFANRGSFGGLKVINLSLGDQSSRNTDCDSLYPAEATIVNALVNAGIAVFAASGNEAHGAGISSPACLSKVISVGAVYDANIGNAAFENCTDAVTSADRVTCYSNSGAPLDLLAPSHCARTPKPGGLYDDCFGGTSAASPYAAAVAAQLISKKPALTPAQLQTALAATGKAVTDPATLLVRPRIDALAAFQNLNGNSGACVRNANTACLLSNRFEVRVTWTTADSNGTAGIMSFGGQRAESDQSAFFWFFSPENFEMGVKMSNACVDPFNRYWVFVSGLTNQGYNVTVRDTQTGATKTYANTLNQLARTVADTSAFSCP